MKRALQLIVIAATLMSAVAHAADVRPVNWTHTSTFVSTSDDLWHVSLSYESSLNASWTMPSDEEAAVILCFREGGQSVVVCGTDPCQLRDRSWPCWYRGSQPESPEFAVILTTRIESVDENRIAVHGNINRMLLVGSQQRQQYAFEEQSFTRTVRINEIWDLSLGEDYDGEEYIVSVRVDGRGTPRTERAQVYSEYVHVSVRHEIEDLRADHDEPLIIRRGGMDIGPGNEDATSVRLEAPLTPHRGDSTVLFTEISFQDVQIRERGRDDLRMTTTFVMERHLAVGVQPEKKPGMTSIDGNLIMSTFEKRITLSPGKALRIEIPLQDGEDRYIDTDEVLELVLDDRDGKS